MAILVPVGPGSYFSQKLKIIFIFFYIFIFFSMFTNDEMYKKEYTMFFCFFRKILKYAGHRQYRKKKKKKKKKNWSPVEIA